MNVKFYEKINSNFRVFIERIKNSNLLKVTKLIVASLLIYLLVKDINLAFAMEIILSSDKLGFLKYAFLLILILLVSSIKYYLILLELDSKIGLIKIFNTNWIGLFINNFVPGGLGMDAYRYVVFKESITGSKSFNLIIMLISDKLIGAIVFFIMSLIFGYELLLSQFLPNINIFLICILFLIFAFFLLFVFIKEKVIKLFSEIMLFGTTPLLIMFVMQIIIVLLMIEAYQCLFEAIHVNALFYDLLKFVPIISLSDYIPFSINGIGIRENLSVFLFKEINISKENTIVQSFIGRIIGICISLIGGIFYIKKNFIKKLKY